MITFIENGQFRTEDSLVPINYLYKVASSIPPQLPDNCKILSDFFLISNFIAATKALKQFADTASSSIASIVVSSFAAQLFL